MPRITLVVAVVLLAASPALAQKGDVTGIFEVKYDDVANNCVNSVQLPKGTLKVEKKGKLIVVDIERFPVMQGSNSKTGKIKASSKIGGSPIDGASVKGSVAGRVEDGLIQLMFVAEFYVDKKPLCTQSWNISGMRVDKIKPKAK
jgi:hypothetical protein